MGATRRLDFYTDPSWQPFFITALIGSLIIGLGFSLQVLQIIVSVKNRKELADTKNPEKRRAELVSEYEDAFANPFIAAERGYVDAVIPPHDTRSHVVRALRALRNKRETRPPRKHGNIPL